MTNDSGVKPLSQAVLTSKKKMRRNFHLMNWSLYPSASAAENEGISDVYGIRAAVVLQLRSSELSAVRWMQKAL